MELGSQGGYKFFARACASSESIFEKKENGYINRNKEGEIISSKRSKNCCRPPVM